MTSPGGPTPKKSSGLGIAALILGIVALVFAFIPLANYFGMVLAVVGLILGIVGLLIKNRAKGLSLTGTILSGLALILAIIMAIVYAAAFSAAVKAVSEAGNSITSTSSSSPSTSSDASSGKTVDVTYEVTSDAATAQSISYFTINNGQSGQEQANGAPLPWSKDLQLKQNGVLDFSTMSLTAQAAQDATTITCTIKVNGVVKSTQTSTGSFAVVSCSTDGK
ncbi:MmpS family transport accessory protein [Humibacter sp.]|uniref:MmpS family transport accessory protein n=1 Tax=Humibacter sp. TaxID=1940291 RepID=UPI003F80DA6A